MIRNAVGTVISRTIVTATTNRTIGRLSARMSTIGPPRIATAAINPTVRTTRTGIAVKMTLPGKVNVPGLPDDGHLCLARRGEARRGEERLAAT